MGNDNFSAFSPMSEEGFSGKYKDYDVSSLEGMSQEQASSPEGAASQGALGTPASAGSAPAFGPADKGKGEAAKPVSDFHRMYISGSDDEKDDVASKMEEQFGAQGLSLQGAVDQVFSQGGEAAMQLAEKFGYVPQERQGGGEAFKNREEALQDYGVQMDEGKERKLAEKKKADNRRAMGGFLMDVGIRMLASNRQDAGGAFGEGMMGARQSRKEDKRQAAQDQLKADETERQRRREDTADEAAKLRAQQQTEKYEYEKTQRGTKEAKAEREGLAQIVAKDGTVHYVNIEEGTVEDEDGVPIRKATAEDLSAAQRRTDARATERTVNAERTRIRKIVAEGFSDDPEIEAIIDEKNSNKKRAMINELADKNLYISTSPSAEDDPLGLL